MASTSTVIWTAVLSTLSLFITVGVGVFFMGRSWAKLSADVKFNDKRIEKLERLWERWLEVQMRRP